MGRGTRGRSRFLDTIPRPARWAVPCSLAYSAPATVSCGPKPTSASQRLVAALEGGQAGGGDTRGQQSAALVIVKKNCGVWLHNDVVLRLQVDDNPEPIKELRRLVEQWNVRRPRGQVGCE